MNLRDRISRIERFAGENNARSCSSQGLLSRGMSSAMLAHRCQETAFSHLIRRVVWRFAAPIRKIRIVQYVSFLTQRCGALCEKMRAFSHSRHSPARSDFEMICRFEILIVHNVNRATTFRLFMKNFLHIVASKKQKQIKNMYIRHSWKD